MDALPLMTQMEHLMIGNTRLRDESYEALAAFILKSPTFLGVGANGNRQYQLN